MSHTDRPREDDSEFLSRVEDAFRARKKAIRHAGGTLEFDRVGGSGDILEVRHTPLGARPTLALELTADQRGTLTVLDNGARSRGKVLLRLESLVLIDNPPEIVAAFEASLRQLSNGGRVEERAVDSCWGKVTLS